MKLCDACGEKEATTFMPDPNGGVGLWGVCEGCKRFIEEAQKRCIEKYLEMRIKHKDGR